VPVLNIYTSPTTKVEIPVGVDDHGDLSGLSDDDHTQYLLANGSRNLTGDLAVDSGVKIDGKDISEIRVFVHKFLLMGG